MRLTGEPARRWAGVALATGLAIAACGTSSSSATRAPASPSGTVSPIGTATSPAVEPSPSLVLTCVARISATGLYEAEIDGAVIGAPRRNGQGDGIAIDLIFDATSKGETYPMLFSIWDPDSSSGPKGISFLFGPRDGSSILVDSGNTPEAGTAAIADDGTSASFDVLLQLGSKVEGTIQCPVVE